METSKDKRKESIKENKSTEIIHDKPTGNFILKDSVQEENPSEEEVEDNLDSEIYEMVKIVEEVSDIVRKKDKTNKVNLQEKKKFLNKKRNLSLSSNSEEENEDYETKISSHDWKL